MSILQPKGVHQVLANWSSHCCVSGNVNVCMRNDLERGHDGPNAAHFGLIGGLVIALALPGWSIIAVSAMPDPPERWQ
jgi:hypothetical protein